MSCKLKYLKYKGKYLELSGGAPNKCKKKRIDVFLIDKIDKIIETINNEFLIDNITNHILETMVDTKINTLNNDEMKTKERQFNKENFDFRNKYISNEQLQKTFEYFKNDEINKIQTDEIQGKINEFEQKIIIIKTNLDEDIYYNISDKYFKNKLDDENEQKVKTNLFKKSLLIHLKKSYIDIFEGIIRNLKLKINRNNIPLSYEDEGVYMLKTIN